MSNDAAKASTTTEAEEKAKRKAQGERYTQIMWGYVCGAITLISIPVGLEPTFIPLGFGVLGSVLAWQLMQKGVRRHSIFAGALNIAGILIWLTSNGPMIQHYLGK